MQLSTLPKQTTLRSRRTHIASLLVFMKAKNFTMFPLSIDHLDSAIFCMCMISLLHPNFMSMFTNSRLDVFLHHTGLEFTFHPSWFVTIWKNIALAYLRRSSISHVAWRNLMPPSISVFFCPGISVLVN